MAALSGRGRKPLRRGLPSSKAKRKGNAALRRVRASGSPARIVRARRNAARKARIFKGKKRNLAAKPRAKIAACT